MSATQGGVSLPVFHTSLYRYICTGTYLGQVDDVMAIPGTEVKMLLSEVSLSVKYTLHFGVPLPD